MTDLKEFYARYPLTVDRTDYLKQVGHTVNGKSINEDDFQHIVEYISELLDLKETDTVLDLCCGNGLISKELAKKCKKFVGVDFSEPLIQIAKQDHNLANISYKHLDILDINSATISDERFNKILMYGALQHFKKIHLETILDNISKISSESPTILIGLVPNRNKKWLFYDTPLKKIQHIIRLILHKELIGTWWDPEYIELVCKNMGMKCSIHELDSKLNAGHYRFDFRIS